MKRLTIYKRTILERTGFKKYPFKEIEQISIIYDNQEFSNHYENINNSRLKVKFIKVLETRNKKKLINYIEKLNNTNTSKWLKHELIKILEKGE